MTVLLITVGILTATPPALAQSSLKHDSKIDISDEIKEVNAHHVKELNRFKMLMGRYPKNANYYFAAGEVVRAMGMINEDEYVPGNLTSSFDLAKKGLALDPKSGRGWTLLGRIARSRKDTKAATEAYQKANEFDPKGARTLMLGGELALAAGKPDEAMNNFKLAELAAKSHKQKVYAIRKQVHAKFDKLLIEKRHGTYGQELAPDLERLVQADPEDAYTLHNAANIYYHFGNFTKAIDLERKALSKMSFGLARFNLGRALVGEALKTSARHEGPSNLEQAEKYVQEAAGLDRASTDVYVQFGIAKITLLKAERDQDTSAIDRVRTQITLLKKLDPKYALTNQLEAGLERLERLKTGRLPATNADAQPNPAFASARQRFQEHLQVPGASQYWLKSVANSEIFYRPAMECKDQKGQLIFGAVVQLSAEGKILSWESEKHSEQSQCMKQLLSNAQFPPPPFAPFYANISFNLLGFLRKHNPNQNEPGCLVGAGTPCAVRPASASAPLDPATSKSPGQ